MHRVVAYPSSVITSLSDAMDQDLGPQIYPDVCQNEKPRYANPKAERKETSTLQDRHMRYNPGQPVAFLLQDVICAFTMSCLMMRGACLMLSSGSTKLLGPALAPSFTGTLGSSHWQNQAAFHLSEIQHNTSAKTSYLLYKS